MTAVLNIGRCAGCGTHLRSPQTSVRCPRGCQRPVALRPVRHIHKGALTVCGAACQNATTTRCDCVCGGKRHGAKAGYYVHAPGSPRPVNTNAGDVATSSRTLPAGTRIFHGTKVAALRPGKRPMWFTFKRELSQDFGPNVFEYETTRPQRLYLFDSYERALRALGVTKPRVESSYALVKAVRRAGYDGYWYTGAGWGASDEIVLLNPGAAIDSASGDTAQEAAADFASGFFKRHPHLHRFAPRKVLDKSGGSGSHPEARQAGDDVQLFPKFWKLDDKTRDFVFTHELGHLALAKHGLAKLVAALEAEGVDPWDSTNLPFGQVNMDEAFADSFATYFLNRSELKQRYPAWDTVLHGVVGGRAWGDASSLEKRAAVFAAAAHKRVGQMRKYTGKPYIVHPAAVAKLVKSVPHTEEQVAAAWLHDTVEDTDVKIEDIEREFGPVVASYVGWLTDVSTKSDGNRKKRKAIDLAHTAAAPAAVHTVKLADLINNSESILHFDPSFAKVYLEEKRALLEVLRDGDPTLFAKAWEIAHTGKLPHGDVEVEKLPPDVVEAFAALGRSQRGAPEEAMRGPMADMRDTRYTPKHPDRPIAEAAVKASDGRVYAARMYPEAVGTHGGASNLTLYFRREGREWKDVAWDTIPKAAYAQLRARLRDSREMRSRRV